MNIREAIDRLNQLAADLPDDTEIRVQVCNGHDEPAINTALGVIDVQRGVDPNTGATSDTTVILEVHPHSDTSKQVLEPLTMGVDAELGRLLDGTLEPAPEPPKPLPPGTESRIFGAMRMPITAEGRPITPGSPDAVTHGCRCDPEKNNYGGGREDATTGDVHFIVREDCPLHRLGDA